MIRSRLRGAAAMLTTLTALSCAGGAARTTARPAADSRPDAAAGATARAESGRQPYTAADVRFMSTMIGHHAQAVAMARLAPTHGASHSIRTLAERIINAQQDEIAIMQRWLRDRGQPVPEPRPDGMMVMSGTTTTMPGQHAHAHAMPGMLTPEQMKQLDQARGKEFDRLFLQFMIQHHSGAVSMVKELIGSVGAAHDDIVFKLASDINVDQTTEIDRMQKMLVALLFESRDP
jgi:uncharacterized protein (DUF305 family)